MILLLFLSWSKIVLMDSTTAFLNELIKSLEKAFPQKVECFKITSSIKAHKLCLVEVAKKAPENLILYLGHGSNDKLSGASETINSSQTFKDFKKKGFINKDNIDIFSNRKVICLSCNSNDKLGEYAFRSGCQSFVGFGAIETDYVDSLTCDYNTVDLFNQVHSKILADAIIYSIQHQFNFDQFEKVLKMMTNQAIFTKSHRNHTYAGEQHDYWIDENLYKLKDEVKIFGNRETLLLEI
jgi:hypothetical protein